MESLLLNIATANPLVRKLLNCAMGVILNSSDTIFLPYSFSQTVCEELADIIAAECEGYLGQERIAEELDDLLQDYQFCQRLAKALAVAEQAGA